MIYFRGFVLKYNAVCNLNVSTEKSVKLLVTEWCMKGMVILPVLGMLKFPSFTILSVEAFNPLHHLLLLVLPSFILRNFVAFNLIRLIEVQILIIEMFRFLNVYFLMIMLVNISVNEMTSRMMLSFRAGKKQIAVKER
jgi:hypothetical protein